MSSVSCPLPKGLDYATAKSMYTQVRKDTNYKLSPEANRREAARRLGTDYDTFSTTLATKGKGMASPSVLTKPVTKAMPDDPRKTAYDDGWLASRNAKNPNRTMSEYKWGRKNGVMNVDDWNLGWTDQSTGNKKWTSFNASGQAPKPVVDPLASLPRILNPGHLEAMIGSNPKFDATDLETFINCGKVINAYELRRRGYDAVATIGQARKNTYELRALWRAPSGMAPASRTAKTPLQMIEGMEAEGIGARFQVYVVWPGEKSAHVFNAERTADGVKFFDAQVSNPNVFRYLYSRSENRSMEWWRVDNADPTGKILDQLEKKVKS